MMIVESLIAARDSKTQADNKYEMKSDQLHSIKSLTSLRNFERSRMKIVGFSKLHTK